jgi:hypothetical protein
MGKRECENPGIREWGNGFRITFKKRYQQLREPCIEQKGPVSI